MAITTKVIYPDGKVEDHKPFIPSFSATAKQMAAAIAAQDALNEGKDIKAAKEVAAQASEQAVQRAEEDRGLAREYLLCICQLGHGNFEGIGPQQLARIAALVAIPTRTFDEWLPIAKGLQR